MDAKTNKKDAKWVPSELVDVAEAVIFSTTDLPADVLERYKRLRTSILEQHGEKTKANVNVNVDERIATLAAERDAARDAIHSMRARIDEVEQKYIDALQGTRDDTKKATNRARKHEEEALQARSALVALKTETHATVAHHKEALEREVGDHQRTKDALARLRHRMRLLMTRFALPLPQDESLGAENAFFQCLDTALDRLHRQQDQQQHHTEMHHTFHALAAPALQAEQGLERMLQTTNVS